MTGGRVKAVSVFLMGLVLFFCFSAESYAARTYTVKKGDNLGGIAKRFGTTVKEIKKENGLKSNAIKPGMKLIVSNDAPKGKKNPKLASKPEEKPAQAASAPAGTVADTPADVNAAEEPKTVKLNKYHTVRKGDSLYSISKKYDLTLEDLRALNGLRGEKASRIKAGEKLVVGSAVAEVKPPAEIPVTSMIAPAPAPASVANSPSVDIPIEKDIFHTIKKGDTLGGIAKKYSLGLEELRRLNGLKKGATIKAGQKLVIKRTDAPPVKYVTTKSYKVKKGDSLIKIARRFGRPVEEIKELNGLRNTRIRPGQALVIEVKRQPSPAELQRMQAEAAQAREAQARLKEELNALAQSPELEEMGLKDKLILFAKTMLDIPYKFGGNSFYGIDCSAYVQRVFNLVGMPLPRTAREQFKEGRTVGLNELAAGDLLFFRTYASFPSHVGIYIGENLFIHASSRGKRVKIDRVDAPFYTKRFIAAKRLLFDEDEEAGR